MLPAADYREKPAQVFPANQGAHNWQPMAFHPGTGLVYIPVRDVGMTFKAVDRYAFDIASSVNDGLDYAAIETTPPKASLLAWDPRRQRAAWRVDHDQVRNGGLLATAGNLVLQGTVDGRLTAYRANDGRQLLALETGTSIMAAPATYAVDGTQYVVVMAGYGGSGLKHYPEGSAARRYGNDGRILAFRLDGGPVPLPPEKDWDENLPPPPALPELTAAERGRARQKFFTYCFVCHNLADEPAGFPNLLRLDAAAHGRFREVVIGGALESRGMASFADVLTEDDARVIHGLLIGMAHEARARKGATRPSR
jgi:quinohemoprotein ethanol dehydrogenase